MSLVAFSFKEASLDGSGLPSMRGGSVDACRIGDGGDGVTAIHRVSKGSAIARGEEAKRLVIGARPTAASTAGSCHWRWIDHRTARRDVHVVDRHPGRILTVRDGLG